VPNGAELGLGLYRTIRRAPKTGTYDMTSRVPPATSSGLLTRREVQCLELLGRGMSNTKISEELAISVPTVALHLVQVTLPPTGTRS